jgi:hypothetical protein
VPRFALIGFGAIAERIVRCRGNLGELPALAGVLVRPGMAFALPPQDR